MNCCQNSDSGIRMPGMGPVPMQVQVPAAGQSQSGCGGRMPMGYELGRFPVGMGYVPMQNWETPYPMGQALMRGTIFPSLDYPFMMRGCR